MRGQQEGGRFGEEELLSQISAAWAAIDAYGSTSSTLLQDMAERALRYVIRAQNADGGWARSKPGDLSDPVATYFAAFAIAGGEQAELTVGKDVYVRANRWIAELEPNDAFSLALKAGGPVLVAKHKGRPAAELLVDRHLPDWEKNREFMIWMLGSIAVYDVDGPRGERWKKWESALKTAMHPHQRRGRGECFDGSWLDDEFGPVYATALNGLAYSVYYRNPGR